jgi:acetoin utilization deacetylase AcuC-like enzyme
LQRLSPRVAEREWLATTHDPTYIDRVEAECKRGAAHIDTPDVSVSAESYDIALLAAGAALELADQVASGRIRNGFALIRPPGHHAEQRTALGFCLFNNVAIAARALQADEGLGKILILDWDVHHGNGTQHSFEEDPSVLYVSLHQYPYYPGTGAYSETGRGRGAGATLNCPMPAGATDGDYELAFRERVLPAVDAFQPEAVLLSAGFDAHHADPLAQINLSTAFYGWMTERMLEIADKHAGGRLIALLEGGYDLDALSQSVAEHLRVLLGEHAAAG